MKRFIIEQTEADLTSHCGLALVGMALSAYTDLSASLKCEIAQRHGIAHADVVRSYLGLLCLGMCDF